MASHGGVVTERIEKRIYFLRKQRVMLSMDLAVLYGVQVRVLVQAVKRNLERFPSDFVFQLNLQEARNLKSQIVISSWGGKRFPPYAFTEQGVAMLSSVLRSKRAVQVNIEIMRAFVRLREMIVSNKELAKRLDELEQKYDSQFKVVFDAIRQLMIPAICTRPPRVCQDSLFSRCRRDAGSDSAGKSQSNRGSRFPQFFSFAP
jgi:hypothetical protein